MVQSHFITFMKQRFDKSSNYIKVCRQQGYFGKVKAEGLRESENGSMQKNWFFKKKLVLAVI